ncbi:MAG: phenylacetate--CoA ligase family protein, partial [Candidatus Hodarchaeota archaeon]
FDLGRGTYAVKVSKLLSQSEWWNREKIQELQNKKIERLIQHAYNHVPYYRSVFDRLGLFPGDIRSVEHLKLIPVLTKKEIRQNFPDSLVARNLKVRHSLHSTNGSTGEPIEFYNDVHTKSYAIAALNRSWGWAGYKVGDRVATFWGNPHYIAESRTLKKRVRNLIFRHTLFSACGLTDYQKTERYVYRLRRLRPEILFGYTQTLYFLARYMKEHQINDVRPKAIITTAETLSDTQRRLLEEQFLCKVFDQYGCGEVESIAYECEAHQGYHIIDEHVVLEFLTEEGSPAKPGESGSIVVTDLDNYVMPFIRYKNGDIGVPSADTCPCGRGLSKIEKVQGRDSDIIFTPDGRVLSLPSFYGTSVLNHIKGLEQYQVVQKSLNQLTIRIVTDESFTQKDLDHLYMITANYVGDQMKIDIEKTPWIEPEEKGKVKLVKSKISLEEWFSRK